MTTPTEELARPYCEEIEVIDRNFEAPEPPHIQYCFMYEGLQAFRSAVEAESDAERMKQHALYFSYDVSEVWKGLQQCEKEEYDVTPHNFRKLLYAQPSPSTEQLQQRVKELEDALRKLVDHALEQEKELDVFHGMGSDAGSGCSVNICEAQKALANTQGDSK